MAISPGQRSSCRRVRRVKTHCAKRLKPSVQEIQDKHRVIPRGGHVLDLGCSPGAWLQARRQGRWPPLTHTSVDTHLCLRQVACTSLGPISAGGSVLGIDLKARCRCYTPRMPRRSC